MHCTDDGILRYIRFPVLQQRLMAPPNTTWAQILAQARASQEVLKAQEVIKSIQNVLQTNVSVCTSLGHPFLTQFNVIFSDMLAVYRLYSELISQTIASGGQHAAKTTFVKYMRSVKKVALKVREERGAGGRAVRAFEAKRGTARVKGGSGLGMHRVCAHAVFQAGLQHMAVELLHYAVCSAAGH